MLADWIEQLISDRELKPGDFLATKEELRTWSGTARATVNEAVRVLCDRGLLFARPGPGGGVFVAKANRLVSLGRTLLDVGEHGERVRDMIAVRDHLETLVFEEAVRHRTASDCEELRAEMQKVREAHDDSRVFVAQIWGLHARIARITPNAVLSELYLGLLDAMRSSVINVANPRERTEEYVDARVEAHQALVDTIISGDETQIPAALKAHGLGQYNEKGDNIALASTAIKSKRPPRAG
jgi:GntR family transcriptional regulator, transcriptional repressor for pyruvate dehydrogenase complex